MVSLRLKDLPPLGLLTLAATTAVAWAVTILRAASPLAMGMEVHPALFMGTWSAMMVAMMLPSALPTVMTFTKIQGLGRPWPFAVGYVALWSAVGSGALAYFALGLPWLSSVGLATTAAGLLLFSASAYQFSRLKDRCIRGCRGPMEFLITRARSGRLGAFIMGLDHGLVCLGCCWLLMSVLVVVGAMGLFWVGVVALAVFGEKVAPDDGPWRRLTAAGLAALGVVVLVAPSLVPSWILGGAAPTPMP